MSATGVLAIDFGTSNTYLCKCPEDQILPQPVELDGDGRAELATVILYREGKEPLIGRTAFEEFGEATGDERRSYTFRAQFKPDIVTSQEARRDAVAFLHTILQSAHRSFLDIEPMKRRVIIGVPAEADQSFRNTLKEVACEAGYGSIKTREEPIGALFYHVAHKNLAASDALRGVLVIDFGGGTCDFTFTERGKIKKPWGHMSLGGRLFDDLFFQWLMEQNPDVAATLSPANEFYVVSWSCRELKEQFSREMTRRGRVEPFSYSPRLGWGMHARLSNATWQEFVERARRYRPSPAFARHLAAMGVQLELAERDEPIDLIGWFRKCLVQGLADSGLESRDIATVILAGGSSLWPFVPDVVQQALHVESHQIRRSERPYAAISEGLAMEPALQDKLRRTQSQLNKDRQRFLQDELGKLVAEHIEDAASTIAQEITVKLFDAKIKVTLQRFRKAGGKIADLKSEIAAHAQRFEPQIPVIVTTATASLSKGLPLLVVEGLQKWFEANGLRIERNMLSITEDHVVTDEICNSELPDLIQDFNRLTTRVLGAVVALITAEVCGGGGMALLMSGPIGWLIGLVLGAAIAYLAVRYGKDKARSMAEAVHLYPLVFRWPLRDSAIASARNKLQNQMYEKVLTELKKLQSRFEEQIEEIVDKEIHALTELHHL